MNEIFGRLTLDAFKHDLIEMAAGATMFIMSLAIVVGLTYYKRWHWLWKEWLTSLDPKKIGTMYFVVTLLMLFKGFIDGMMLRTHQMLAFGDSEGFLASTHFQQIFTVHGVVMIFFVAMGAISALMNLIIPLQIGARDVAFPLINSISFWLYAAAVALVNLSLVVGNFSGCGWLAYPPLSGLEYSPGVGIDYWIWALQIAGVGTTLTGINFWVTIFKMRCPGMTLMKMPVFVWACLGALVLIIFAFPIITVALGMLGLDRYLGMHFFTSNLGGNPMLFVNLIWCWGHPEVYILILPSFGIYSEVVATFSRKRLFGYTSMVWAIIGIVFLSFLVWLHHFFTMGAGPAVNAFFGVMTMLIAIPTGVKIFNWLFTMYQGRIQFPTPMLWFLGFVIIFSIGGMGGVLMGLAPADFQIHNSLFLIAHFHSMIIPGVLFGVFAGFTYWFPKIMGYKLNERLGRYACFFWTLGFLLAFMPLYTLGLMGATRRVDHLDGSLGWQPMYVVTAIGAVLIGVGIVIQFIQLYVSHKHRHENMDTTGDPWNGRTLEWSTSSPAPVYNYAILPEVDTRDPFWVMKQEGEGQKLSSLHYTDIHMPKNSALGFYMGVFGFLCCFGLTWYMTWLAILGICGIIGCIIVRTCQEHTEFTISAAEVKKEAEGNT